MRLILYLQLFVILLVTTAFGTTGEDIFSVAEAGNIDSIKILLTNDPALINVTNDGGYTPLHEASYAGHIDFVDYLISLGADVKATSNSGSTSLHGAAYYNHPLVVESLIKAGADVNVANAGGYTPLLSAIAAGNQDIAFTLITHGADPNVTGSDGQTVLMLAAQSGNRDLTELILSKHPDLEKVDSYDRTALILTARENGSTEIAKLLITAGANINAKDKFNSTSLELASWRGFSGLVNLLLDNGVELPSEIKELNKLLTYSTEKNLPRLFTLMVAQGADVSGRNPNEGSYLHSASTGGNSEIVEGLINQGLQINEVDKYGWAPLHCAVSRNRIEATQILLDKGADINATTTAGYTPLSIAQDRGYSELAELLIQKEAKQNLPSFVTLEGPYLGQQLPGETPVWFAPDIVSSNRFEHSNVVFSSDGTEAFWSSSFYIDNSGYTWSRMMTSHIDNGQWTKPVMTSFSSIKSGDDGPFYNADCSKLYFNSMRSIEEGGEGTGFNLWVVDRTANGWSDAYLAPPELQETRGRSYRSMANSGNIYSDGRSNDHRNSADIFVSRFSNGQHLSPVNLGWQINSTSDEHTCIAPDESYMVLKRDNPADGFGDADLLVSFRDENNSWTTPMILPVPINSASRDWYPSITMDGKYLIFNSHRGGSSDYYWVLTNVILKHRDIALKTRHASKPNANGISLRKSEQSFGPVYTNSVGLADLDGDGDLDLACANMHDNDSRVWLNDGLGNYTVTEQLFTQEGHGIALEDVDTDGDMDMFITCADENHKTKLYLNDGAANFDNSEVAIDDSTISGNKLEMHDIDNDGDLDVMIVYYQEDDGLFLNDGTGQFSKSDMKIPENASWCDLDNDGDIDILAREIGAGFKGFFNDGKGNFTVKWEKTDSTVVRGSIGFLDLDSDGDLDAVVGNGGNGPAKHTNVWLNDGSGKFHPSNYQLPTTYNGRFVVGDLNNDSYPDLFVTNFGMPDQVWLNDGNGKLFDTGFRLSGCGTTVNPALGDIDSDGDLDIIVPDFVGRPNVIWFNELIKILIPSN